MQISVQETTNVQKAATSSQRTREQSPVRSVAELADRNGVRMAEVRRFTENAMLAEDPQRERRIRELERRVAEDSYHVDADQVVDMADRRAIADGVATF